MFDNKWSGKSIRYFRANWLGVATEATGKVSYGCPAYLEMEDGTIIDGMEAHQLDASFVFHNDKWYPHEMTYNLINRCLMNPESVFSPRLLSELSVALFSQGYMFERVGNEIRGIIEYDDIDNDSDLEGCKVVVPEVVVEKLMERKERRRETQRKSDALKREKLHKTHTWRMKHDKEYRDRQNERHEHKLQVQRDRRAKKKNDAEYMANKRETDRLRMEKIRHKEGGNVLARTDALVIGATGQEGCAGWVVSR